MIGIRSNVFRDFLGCRCSILISEIVIRFGCPLAFQCHIPNYSTAKLAKIWRKENGKLKMIARLFFIFWIRSNIFRDFLGCRCSILISETIIRFVFPLAFQSHIPNCYTVKTREATVKTRQKVKNDGKGGV